MYTHEEMAKTASCAVLPDKRLNKRLQQILMQLDGRLQESIPVAFADPGQSKAYYRFINHEGVEAKALLEANRQVVLQQAPQERGVLAIQDTTELDLTGKRSAKALGCLSYAHQKGLFLHNHLLLDEQGQVLGLLDQQFFERDPSQLGGSKKKRRQPFEHKESFRWLEQFNQLQECFKEQTHQQVIQICDREADIHELLQARTTTHVHYIIRSSQNRTSELLTSELLTSELLTSELPTSELPTSELPTSESAVVSQEGSTQTMGIWQQMAAKPGRFTYQLPVDHPEHGKRLAHLQVRYAELEIKPGYRPKQQQQLVPVKLWLVETSQVEPPEGVEPLCWRLLTSLPVADNEQAQRVIRYYTYRWRIERFHYVLKQGAQVEQLQLQQVEALKKAIILYSWIALKVLQTQHLLVNQPQAPITSIGLSELDYLIAYQYLKGKAVKLPAKSLKPTLIEWAQLIVRIVGGRLPKDNTIGVVTLWRAYSQFFLIRQAYFAFKDVGNQ